MITTEIYNKYRDKVVSLLIKQGLDLSTAKDVYQDTMCAVEQNKDKIYDLNASYICKIAFNLMYKEFYKRKNTIRLSSMPVEMFESIEPSFEDTELIEVVHLTLSKMKPIRREVLEKFYFEDKRHDEIAEELCLRGSDSSKSQKSKGMKDFKNLILEQYSKEDLI